MASSGYLLYYVLHYEEKKFDGTLLSELPVNYNDRYNEERFHEEKKIWNDIKRYQNKSHNDNVQEEKRDNGVRSLHRTISV